MSDFEILSLVLMVLVLIELALFVPALSENKKIAAPSQRFAATFSSSY